MMMYLTAAALSSLLLPCNAFIVLCGNRLYDQRIDAVITPGVVSPHVHTVVGGNGMNFSMGPDLATHATCTTCDVKEDLSNYWTPKLYFHDKKTGQFEAVPQSGDSLPEGTSKLAGQKVYYLSRGGPHNDKLNAFPPGFRMIAGNPFKRSGNSSDFATRAISFHCLDYYGNSPQKDKETNYLPDYNCPSGIRAQVFFPQCWNGKAYDGSNPSAHMSYPDPTQPGDYNGGACPSSHPIHMVSIFFEVAYDTQNYVNRWYDGKNPFVFAHGDPTGYGYHGDFVNGWVTDASGVSVLQSALNGACDGGGADASTCSKFTMVSGDAQASCSIPKQVIDPITKQYEDVYGPFSALPGCNPIQSGPASATIPANCPQATIGPYQTSYTDLTSRGWAYVGCVPDSVNDRTFSTPMAYNSTTETLMMCNNYCSNKGYTIGAVEYGSQCFCGNSIRKDRVPSMSRGNCYMPCPGYPKSMCGGPNALSTYRKCTPGAPCKNAQYVHVS